MLAVLRHLDGPARAVALAALVCSLLASATLASRAAEPSPTPARARALAGSAGVPSPPPSSAPAAPAATPSATATPVPTPDAVGAQGVGITVRRTSLRAAPDASSPRIRRLRAGIPLPLLQNRRGFASVMTPCEVQGWVPLADVRVQGAGPAPGSPMPFGQATLVLDPGHGGPESGAPGPTGLLEKDVNLDIVRRLAALLASPHDVDWSTGAVRDGNAYGPPRVVLSRVDDYEAGLGYRAAVANALKADAFVSVHNNSDPDGPWPQPGTETYYQFRSARSKRLAGLAYEEIFRTLSAYQGLAWVADRDAGAKYRLSDSGLDYYAVLRRTVVPSVIVESAFISNAPEEALLRRDDVRQALADALYRALVRFITTADAGSGFVEPYPRGSGGSPFKLPSSCADPA